MPDVVDGDKVTANPDQLRSAGREWGTKSGNFDKMNNQLGAAEAKLPGAKLSGRRGEEAREFMGQLKSATGRLADAYSKIGSMAPRVADAVEDAKQAQQKRDKTKQDAEAAKKELTEATAALHEAQRAVTAARSAHGILGEVAAAAAKAVLAAARLRHDAARTDYEAKAKAAATARTAFQDAERDRKRISDRFADLVNEQTAVIRKAAPAAPIAPVVAAIPLLTANVAQVMGLSGPHHDSSVPDVLKVLGIAKSAGVYKVSANAEDLLRALGSGVDPESFVKHLGTASTGVGALASVVTSSYAADKKGLTGQAKQDYMFRHTFMSVAGGLGGGAVVKTLLKKTLGGYLGGYLGDKTADAAPVRIPLDFVSQTQGNAAIAGPKRILHAHNFGDVLHGGYDMSNTMSNAMKNTGTKTLDKGLDIVGVSKGTRHDITNVAGTAVDLANPIKAPENVYKGVSKGVKWVFGG